MKQFKNIKVGDQENSPTAINMITSALKHPKNPNKGTDYGEMAEVYPVLKKFSDLEKDNTIGVMHLIENSEHQLIVDRLKTVTFSFNDLAVYEWIKQMEELQDVAVNALSDEAKAANG